MKFRRTKSDKVKITISMDDARKLCEAMGEHNGSHLEVDVDKVLYNFYWHLDEIVDHGATLSMDVSGCRVSDGD